MGTDFLDYYWLHDVNTHSIEVYDKLDCWSWIQDKKKAGDVRHIGFSFHDGPELLDKVLTEPPEFEYVQLQINYADWENPGVASRRNWEICKAHGKPVTVMEPVKGGILADPISTVKEVLDASGSGLSYAGWAIRFVASRENILVVLSGMSSLDQMRDNLSFMRDFRPLDEAEEEAIRKAQEALNADQSIPCTGCRYCTEGCPNQIPIPDIFTVANRRKGSPHFRTVREYDIVTQGRGRASDCVQCGQCEEACPQHLPIITLLEQCREMEE